MSSTMEDRKREKYPGAWGDTWDTAYLTKLSKLLASHNELLRRTFKTALTKRKRCAAKAVARGLGRPLASPAAIIETVRRFIEIYREKAAQIPIGAPIPPWIKAVSISLGLPARSANTPDPAEAVLLALIERSRSLRTTSPALVCSLEMAPQARPEQLARVWESMVAAVTAKLDAFIAGGDSEAGLQADTRLSRAEWRLADALLLHDHSGAVRVVREEHARRAEPLRALVAVFHLVQLFQLEARAGGWRAAAAAYRRRGRLASAVLLQRRWHDLKHQTRCRLQAASRPPLTGGRPPPPAPLHLAVARRFPQVVVAPLPSWRSLVESGAILEECDLTQDLPADEESPQENGGLEALSAGAGAGAGAEPPPGDAEDDLILVEREIETVDLMAGDDDEFEEQVETGNDDKVTVKREADTSAEDTREVLRARRRQMALALERELDKQLRDLGGEGELSPPRYSPLIIYDSDEDTPNDDGRIKDEIENNESDESTVLGRSEDDEPSIDPKLLMTTSVPLMRVDEPGWQDLAPPRDCTPAGGDIRIVAIKSEQCLGVDDDGTRRGRIRLPDISEVRRINRGMKIAQVAPLVPPDTTADAAAGSVVDVSSRRSSGEGQLYIDEGDSAESDEGGVLTGPELRRVLRACGWGTGRGGAAESPERGRVQAGGTRWRELYCCAARYHRALNDARRRCAARGGRAPPLDAPVHAARCGTRDEGSCACCCAHLLDAERAARAQAEQRARLLADVRAVLDGTYEPEQEEKAENELAPPVTKKAKKRKRDRNRGSEDPPPEPAADPLQEWIRQKNITSRFFDLNLKKPEKPHKPPEPAIPTSTTPQNAPVLTDTIAPAPICTTPASQATPAITAKKRLNTASLPRLIPISTPFLTLSNGKIVCSSSKLVNKVKVTVKTGEGTSTQSLLLPKSGKPVPGGSVAEGPIVGSTKLVQKPAAVSRNRLEQVKKPPGNGAEVPGGPEKSHTPTRVTLTTGLKVIPVEKLIRCAPSNDVIDLCDDEPSPSPSPSPPPASPSPPPSPSPPMPSSPSHALILGLPPGISVKRRHTLPPQFRAAPAPDEKAQKILLNLPPGIQVKRKGKAFLPSAPPKVVLNEQMEPSPTVTVSPYEKKNIKVFKISEDGMLTLAGAGVRVAGPGAGGKGTETLASALGTKVVMIPRKNVHPALTDASVDSNAPVVPNASVAHNAPVVPDAPVAPDAPAAPDVPAPPRLLNSLLGGTESSNKRFKIAEFKTTSGRRMVVVRPPAGRPAPAPPRLTASSVVALATSGSPPRPTLSMTLMTPRQAPMQMSATTSKLVNNVTVPFIAPVQKVFNHRPAILTPRGNSIFTSQSPPTVYTHYSMPVIAAPLMSGGVITTTSTILTPTNTAETEMTATEVTSTRTMPAILRPIVTLKKTLPKTPPKPKPQESRICKFEITPEETVSDARAEIKPKGACDAPPEESVAPDQEDALMTLQGGAVVRPAEPTYDFSERTLTLEEWAARGGSELVQIAERGAPLYWARGHYVRSSQPLPMARAAVWTPGPVSLSRRLLVRSPPVVLRGSASCLVRLGGLAVRAEWVCRSSEQVARAARAGARLAAVEPGAGRALPLRPARAPRPGLLALRCEALGVAQKVTHDVNLVAPEHIPGYVRIAPRPLSAPVPVPSEPPTPPPPSADPSPPLSAAPKPRLYVIEPLTAANVKKRQSLLKPVTPEKRPSSPLLSTPAQPPLPPPAPTPPSRPPTPPEPRRSSRRAAHDARAKLNDMIKQDSNGGEISGEGASGEDETLDFSVAAGLEAPDSDDDYDADDDLRQGRNSGRRGRGKRYNSHAQMEEHWATRSAVRLEYYGDREGEGRGGDDILEKGDKNIVIEMKEENDTGAKENLDDFEEGMERLGYDDVDIKGEEEEGDNAEVIEGNGGDMDLIDEVETKLEGEDMEIDDDLKGGIVA